MFRRWILPLMAAFFIIIPMTSEAAETSKGEAEADYLNALGLLQGDGQTYNLDGKVTRLQGAVMVVRLIGKEEEALALDLDHPFEDVPDWGSPYVGYMYEMGLTQGQEVGIYGSDDNLTEVEYVTFLLRVLGYSDSEGDFRWYDALDMAESIGMTETYEAMAGDFFQRRHMAVYTVKCLESSMKSGGDTLLEVLENQGSLRDVAATATSLYRYQSLDYDITPDNADELGLNLVKMLYHIEEEMTFDMSRMSSYDFSQVMDAAIQTASAIPGYGSLVSGYQMSQWGNSMTVTFEYKGTAEEIQAVKLVVKARVSEIIAPAMTDMEKELEIHDYIVNNIQYDTGSYISDASYTIIGAVRDGKAVCQGYAELFQLMSYYAGLSSQIVVGEGTSGGYTQDHAWNLVEIDGLTYHVDTTWDDPIMADGSDVLTYSYFNLTDEAMSADHSWNHSAYPACTALDHNYYVYYRQAVYSKQQLKDYLQEAFDDGQETIHVKLMGERLTMSELSAILDQCYGYGNIVYSLDGNTNVITIERS